MTENIQGLRPAGLEVLLVSALCVRPAIVALNADP
jgi:hypothetical protein